MFIVSVAFCLFHYINSYKSGSFYKSFHLVGQKSHMEQGLVSSMGLKEEPHSWPNTSCHLVKRHYHDGAPMFFFIVKVAFLSLTESSLGLEIVIFIHYMIFWYPVYVHNSLNVKKHNYNYFEFGFSNFLQSQ